MGDLDLDFTPHPMLAIQLNSCTCPMASALSQFAILQCKTKRLITTVEVFCSFSWWHLVTKMQVFMVIVLNCKHLRDNSLLPVGGAS